MGFPRLVEKVSGQDSGSFFIGGNPLALRNRSIPLITIEQESWCRARSIIGGERTAGRQSKRFVTPPEERVRCSIGEEERNRVDGDDVRFISGFLAVKIIAEYNWWKIEK